MSISRRKERKGERKDESVGFEQKTKKGELRSIKDSTRVQAKRKGKKRRTMRVVMTLVWFLAVFAGLILMGLVIVQEMYGGLQFGEWGELIGLVSGGTAKLPERTESLEGKKTEVDDKPSAVEVVDGSGATVEVGARMKEYIGRAEKEFRGLGYVPVKVMIPADAVREVDFYLEGVPGYIKMVIDRGVGVSVEDAQRMLKYLEEIGMKTFSYVDVRVEGKGYWK